MFDSLNSSDYIALSSAVIALLAFSGAIWQGWLSRRHNFLTVKPILHINKSYLNVLDYTLENNGLGPAVIKEYSILINGKRYTNPKSDPFPEIFSNLGVEGIGHEFGVPSINSAHTPGTSTTLLHLYYKNMAAPLMIDKIDKAIDFKIIYTSVYENENYTCLASEHY